MLAQVCVGDAQVVEGVRQLLRQGLELQRGREVSNCLGEAPLRVSRDAALVEQLGVLAADLQRPAEVRLGPVVKALLEEALCTIGEVEGLVPIRLDGCGQVDHRLGHVPQRAPGQATLAEDRRLCAPELYGLREVFDGVVLTTHPVVNCPSVVAVPAVRGFQRHNRVKILQRALVVAHVTMYQTARLMEGLVLRQDQVECLQRPLKLPVQVVHGAKVEAGRMVLRVMPQGFLVVNDSLADAAAALVCETFVMDIRGVVRLQLDCLGVIDQGLTMPAQLKACIATVEMNRCVVWLCVQGSCEVRNGFLILTHVVARQPPIVVVSGTRVVLNGASKTLLGVLKGLLLHVGESEVVVRLGAARLQVDCLLQVFDGLR
mmetsp:Transcript_96644/g.268678  ORF Transcript_96644/g.268678 Transcript_96644/m.268678 type:complete len:374 (-) Transcript_96644:189-1310(-)